MARILCSVGSVALSFTQKENAMRALVLVVAAVATTLFVVNSRKNGALAPKSTKRKKAIGRAAKQKPGQVVVPKTPKVKRGV